MSKRTDLLIKASATNKDNYKKIVIFGEDLYFKPLTIEQAIRKQQQEADNLDAVIELLIENVFEEDKITKAFGMEDFNFFKELPVDVFYPIMLTINGTIDNQTVDTEEIKKN